MLVVTLCLMSLAALPTLIFAGVGSRISSSKMDSAGFAALTLGNIGGCTNLNTSSAITLTSVNCTSERHGAYCFVRRGAGSHHRLVHYHCL